MTDHSKFVPPKGMRDWLPSEIRFRQKLIHLIETSYQLYGFEPIDTPVMENIEVLQGKGGGENEKLMFKVMKRGEELRNQFIQAGSGTPPQNFDPFSIIHNIPDMGLRFDMTVPLARYVGNHFNELSKPFRCYHIGPVWRADRPQKGRFREFYQCDIDIVGGTSQSYEVELLLATDRVLKALNIGKFKIRISHKKLLPALLTQMGVSDSGLAGMAVAIDKLDKQPFEQVWKEIENLGQLPEVMTRVEKFLKKAQKPQWDLYSIRNDAVEVWLRRNDDLEDWRRRNKDLEDWMGQVESIRHAVHEINPEAQIEFDPLLVRGFDYYTGPVFEINVEEKAFTFSIGGGGRYDGLIEKLGGPKNTPAVGLSLGFERILTVLMEREGGISKNLQSRVYLVNKGQSLKDIQILAEMLRSQGIAVETGLEKKDAIKQLITAEGSGLEYAITDFVPGAASFKVRRLSNRQDTEMTVEQLREALKKVF